MAYRRFLRELLLCSTLILLIRGDAVPVADPWSDPESGPDPASCCSRPTTFVKGNESSPLLDLHVLDLHPLNFHLPDLLLLMHWIRNRKKTPLFLSLDRKPLFLIINGIK